MARTRRAEIHMLPTDAGGLREPLQTPTRHLVLMFHGDEQLQIGANITVNGDAPLEPGASYSVQLNFWAPEAESALAHRDQFDLWAGRKLGFGRLSPDQS